jgi:hypothetical protein
MPDAPEVHGIPTMFPPPISAQTPPITIKSVPIVPPMNTEENPPVTTQKNHLHKSICNNYGQYPYLE